MSHFWLLYEIAAVATLIGSFLIVANVPSPNTSRHWWGRCIEVLIQIIGAVLWPLCLVAFLVLFIGWGRPRAS